MLPQSVGLKPQVILETKVGETLSDPLDFIVDGAPGSTERLADSLHAQAGNA
jgi:hypothetical protein